MKPVFTLLITLCLMVTGCATIKPIKMTEQNTVIVMAKEVDKFKGPSNISDVFTYEGNIYAYTTFHWVDQEEFAGKYKYEIRWYNGDKRISSNKFNFFFKRTPHYVWSMIRGTAMGVGKCRADVYMDDVLVGTKPFTVVEKQ